MSEGENMFKKNNNEPMRIYKGYTITKAATTFHRQMHPIPQRPPPDASAIQTPALLLPGPPSSIPHSQREAAKEGY